MSQLIFRERPDPATAPRYLLTLGQTYRLSVKIDCGDGWELFSMDTVLRYGPFMANTPDAQQLILRTLFDPTGVHGLAYDAFDSITPAHIRLYISGDTFYLCSSGPKVRVQRMTGALLPNEIDLWAAFTDHNEDDFAEYQRDALISTKSLQSSFEQAQSLNTNNDAYTVFFNGKFDGSNIFPQSIFFNDASSPARDTLAWLVSLQRFLSSHSVSSPYKAVSGNVSAIMVNSRLALYVKPGHTFIPKSTPEFNGQSYKIDPAQSWPHKFQMDIAAVVGPFIQDVPPPDATDPPDPQNPAIQATNIINAVTVAAALRAQIDQTTGWHKSLSNIEVTGPTGISQSISWELEEPDTDAGYLNSHDVTTLINHNGLRFWGNRNCSDDPRYAFEVYTRSAQTILQTIIDGCFPFIDQPLTPMLAREIIDSINAKLSEFVRQGRLIGAKARYDDATNTTQLLSQGQFWVVYDYTPVPTLENLGLNQRITDSYLIDFAQFIAQAG